MQFEVQGTAALFASASADGSVRLWSAKCWTCLRIFTVPAVPTVPFSPAAAADHSRHRSAGVPFLCTVMSTKYTATGSSDGAIRLWSSEECVPYPEPDYNLLQF